MRSTARHVAAGWCTAGCLVALLADGGPRLGPASLSVLRTRFVADPESVVEGLALDAAWVLALWLSLGTLTHLASRLPGRVGPAAGRVSAVITPAVLRRALDVTVGLGAVALPVTPAVAAPLPVAVAAPPPVAVASVTLAAPEPLGAVPAPRLAPLVPTPDLDRPSATDGPSPTGGRAPAPAPHPHLQPPQHAPVVVGPGDSLWAIAASRLGPAAGPAQVAAAWPAWWTANRATIGADPDLLRPGQRLLPPSGGRS